MRVGPSTVLAPPASRDAVIVPHGLSLEEAERLYGAATLEACGGNKTEAARRLGISRNRMGRIVKS